MKLKRIFSFFISCLLLVFISFQSFAAVQSSSNAVMALPLDEDSGISLYSSLGTVTNTPKFDSNLRVFVRYRDNSDGTTGVYRVEDFTANSSGVSFQYQTSGDIVLYGFYIYLKYQSQSYMPPAGSYAVSADFSSQFSIDYSTKPYIWSQKTTDNASVLAADIRLPFKYESGDFYIAPYTINYTGSTYCSFGIEWPYTQGLQNLDGSFRINFKPVAADSSAPNTAGVNSVSDEIQSSINDNTTQLLNTSNSIYDSLQDLIQHISNQLAALWDQMYNLMHVPTMDKLNEILSALRAIANNSDIYAVVEEIDSSSREQTSQIVQNANENTSKVEQAVEKHGNFIIEGLKGLFIPSDEYFKSYFDDLYTFFSDRFGFLSFPIDLLQRLADLFLNSVDVDCVLTLPSFEISGEQLLIEQSFNLTEFLETNFSMLLSALRIVGDCIIIGAFVNLCSKKWDEVMKN